MKRMGLKIALRCQLQAGNLWRAANRQFYCEVGTFFCSDAASLSALHCPCGVTDKHNSDMPPAVSI